MAFRAAGSECLTSLIRNPVQIGGGPATVTLSFRAERKETPSALSVPLSCFEQDGKAADGGGKPGDLPEYFNGRLRGQGSPLHPGIKSGNPGLALTSPGFFVRGYLFLGEHMITSSKRVGAGLVLGGFLVAVAAQGRAEPEAGVAFQALPELETLVVTATRYAERVGSVPANVTTITEADIADSTARGVPEILRREVGLHVYDIMGNGWSYRLDRSGFGAKAGVNTLVLVDGRRINNPDLSGADWTLIPLDRVARIETVRGSRGSVLYGDNATDGVINVITKGGTSGFRFGVEGAGGSYDTLNPSAYVKGTYDDLSYAVSGRHHKSDGYRENSDTKQSDIGLNLGYALGEVAHIGLSAGYHEGDTGLPGALRRSELAAGVDRRDSTHPLDFSDMTDYYVQLNPELYFLENSAFRIPLSYRKREMNFFSSFDAGEFRGNTTIDSVTASPQLVIEEPTGRFANGLTLGFDYYRADEDIRNQRLFFGLVDVGRFDLKKKNYGAYVHEAFSATDQLVLSAGYRWDHVDYEFSPTAPGTRSSVDYDEEVLSAGVNYQFSDSSHLYFSFAQGFRYPVLDEIFSFFKNRINADLRPQTTDNYELGVRHDFTDNLYGSLNLFRLDTKDELFYNSATFANENLGPRTRREGVEVAAGLDAGRVSLRGSYTYRDTEIRGGAFTGNDLPNVPRHQASLGLVWRPIAGLSLALNGVQVGARYFEGDFANGFEKQDDYRIFNLKVKYARQKYTAFLDLNNVFNEKYAAYGVISSTYKEPALYPSPEFNLFAGVRFDY